MNNCQVKGFLLFSCLLLLVILCSCQLPLANAFRDNVFPESTGAKVALFPLLLPAYAVLSVLDITLINPVRGGENVPKTVGPIWQWQNESPLLGYALLMPFKLAAIPVAAIGTVMFSEQFISTQKTND